MKLKAKTSLNFLLKTNKKKENGQSNKNEKEKKKFFLNKKNKFSTNNSKIKNNNHHGLNNEKKIIKNILNIEDSSTNYFSGMIKKKIPKICNIKKIKDKDNLIIPFLIQKESDTESLFINFKLGEKDSYSESTLKSDLENNDCKVQNKKIINMKSNNNKNKNKIESKSKIRYDYCYVDNNIGKNESNSLEIYDFTDKNNEDYVLNNISVLSYSKSEKDKSFYIDDFNDDINMNKNINKIKIFNTKNNCLSLNIIKNNNIKKYSLIKNKFNFRPNYKY